MKGRGGRKKRKEVGRGGKKEKKDGGLRSPRAEACLKRMNHSRVSQNSHLRYSRHVHRLTRVNYTGSLKSIKSIHGNQDCFGQPWCRWDGRTDTEFPDLLLQRTSRKAGLVGLSKTHGGALVAAHSPLRGQSLSPPQRAQNLTFTLQPRSSSPTL